MCIRDRYLRRGEQSEPEAMIVHLNPAEQRTIIQVLVEQRERQEQAMSQTEQLLRRMTGSITAYMEEVGQRPLRMSDYDKTVLAIRDGELSAFWALYPKALDQADSLLVETAGRPGAVGRRMTLSLLSVATNISPSSYLLSLIHISHALRGGGAQDRRYLWPGYHNESQHHERGLHSAGRRQHHPDQRGRGGAEIGDEYDRRKRIPSA